MEELELFIKIYQEGICPSSLRELLKELDDIDDIETLERFIKECRKKDNVKDNVKDFRECVKEKIRKEKNRLIEANAQKLKNEQEKRRIPKPAPSTVKPPGRRRR